MRISVLGLGRMGTPIAQLLAELGHEITLFDCIQEKALEAAKETMRVAGTVPEAVRDAQVALTLVSGEEAVLELTLGPEGLLAHLPAGAIHLCMSTIGVEASRRLALAHAEAGQGYVAAPIIGSGGAATSRRLWAIVGGPEVQVNRCMTILESFTKGITRVGPRAELAHALKLGESMLTVAMVESLAEVLAFGEKAGFPPAEYLRLLNTAQFRSPAMDAFGSLMVRRCYEPADQPLDAVLLDMQATIESAEDMNAVMPLSEMLHQRIEAGLAQGWGSLDLAALSRDCRMSMGLDGEPTPEADQPESGSSAFQAMARDVEVELHLNEVTYFERFQDSVWVWSKGKRYRTPWRHLAEIEKRFPGTRFLRVHRHILLRPEATRTHPLAADLPAGSVPVAGMDASDPGSLGPPVAFAADGEGLEDAPPFAETTHFELESGIVWAWAKGVRHPTSWRSLDEIEQLFHQVLLLRVQPHILLNPESVVSVETKSWGRSIATVEGGLELRVRRSVTPKLREITGT